MYTSYHVYVEILFRDKIINSYLPVASDVVVAYKRQLIIRHCVYLSTLTLIPKFKSEVISNYSINISIISIFNIDTF